MNFSILILISSSLMLGNNKIIKALKGDESLLLILPKDAGSQLDIAHQDLLKFEIKNGRLIIKKIEVEEI